MPRNVVIAFASATSGAVLTALLISRIQKSAWVDLVESTPVKHLSTLDLMRAATNERVAAARRHEAQDEYDKRDTRKLGFYNRPRSRSRA